jgi:NAD(P)-dependent dehydrogenase (short-subunit alcohol dehydrogenase family)
MSYDFGGKSVFITGAASGIGYATARAFADAGASVALADANEAAVTEAAARLGAGPRVIAVRCDVTEETEVEEAVNQAAAAFGRLDIAYNNAGIHVPVAPTAEASTADFDRLMAVNARGVWLSMKHELRHMQRQGGGVIVNCSSQSGISAAPGLGAYVASKHAVIGMSRAAALENAARGIRVNVVAPGSTDTPMVATALADHPAAMQAAIDHIPLGRLGRPEEIASAVLWLASPGAAFMIGQVVAPDGGYTVP